MTDAMRDQLQASLGEGYVFERELGGGGMSRVFLARDLRLARPVVVKALSTELAAGISAERFTREIRVAAALQEPHIVPVLSDGVTAGGIPYYVMPFVRGASLRERMASGPVPIAEAIGILRDVAKALAYAHRAGIVHRDIKPENILLSEGTAMVADFGIAKAVEAATHDGAARATGLTTAGVAIGTPAYMAPEQAVADGSVDQRADLYALGVIAYELLTGTHPFAGRTAQALMAAHLTETPQRLGQRRIDSPPALDALVMRLLAKDPAARPESADVVVRALDQATGEQHPPRLGRRRLLATLGVALVVLGAFAAWRWSVRAPDAGADGASPRIRTVAVLPFVNTSGSADDEYFSDGLTDELAHALSRVPGLRIAGRTSSYTFKGKTPTAQEIGRVLDVGAFVSGSMRRAGDRLRVATQLVSAADGKVMWDSVYESRSGDVFAVQDSLTHAIVASLAPMLGMRVPDVHVADRARGTSDQEAYDLYLKGRYYWLQRGEANIRRSVDYLRAAVARDSTFARAHAALAMAYSTTPSFFVSDSSGTPASRIERAVALMEASARRAAALDSTLADAQLALGVSLDYELRFQDALTRYRKAVALDPSSSTARHWLGMSLLNLGRTDEAIEELRRGTDLDPLALMPNVALGTALLFARRFPEAASQARRSLTLDSTFAFSIMTLSESQALAGAADSAIATAERGVRLHPGDSRLLTPLLFALATAGRWDDAARIRARLRAQGDRSGSADPAFAELVFGDPSPMLAVLTSREGQRRFIGSGGLFGCDPLLDPLWTDQRFVAAMRALSVTPCGLARPWPLAPRRTR